MNSKKQVEYKSRQLKVAMYLLQRIFGKKATKEILGFIEERFCTNFVLDVKRKMQRPTLPPELHLVGESRSRRRERMPFVGESSTGTIGTTSTSFFDTASTGSSSTQWFSTDPEY